jgi:cytochrome o ubiquinol oxidase subunit II
MWLWYYLARNMGKKYKIGAVVLLGIIVVVISAYLLRGSNFMVLNPGGTIAAKQRDLIVFASLLSLVVVIPVFTMLFVFAHKYREENTKAKYTPNWDTDKGLEAIWWGVPILLIVILSVVTWRTSHSLDPYKPLESSTQPITIQVVALEWKWLFIYPEQGVASVNMMQFPVDTPVNFEITADAPMNSFWIPQLGGQIYAMPGMQTKLHLMADEVGTYNGVSANLSGEGFAGMRFDAKATSEADFYEWVFNARNSSKSLESATYNQLALPSKNNPTQVFNSVDPDLYDSIIDKYMSHGHGGSVEMENHGDDAEHEEMSTHAW